MTNNKSDISSEHQNNQTHLGDFLKTLRSKQGYTLRELENLTGISNTYISNLENGKKDAPSMETLFKLSKVYINIRPLAFIEMLEYSNLVSKMDILTMKGALIEDRHKNLIQKGHVEQTKLGSLNVNHSITDKNKYNLNRILNQINHNVSYNDTNLNKYELNIIDDLIQSLIKNREKNKEGD